MLTAALKTHVTMNGTGANTGTGARTRGMHSSMLTATVGVVLHARWKATVRSSQGQELVSTSAWNRAARCQSQNGCLGLVAQFSVWPSRPHERGFRSVGQSTLFSEDMDATRCMWVAEAPRSWRQLSHSSKVEARSLSLQRPICSCF